MARRRSAGFPAPARGQRWTEDDAKAALDAWAESKLSAVAFARKHGFDPQRLYWWRRRSDAASPAQLPEISFEELDLGATGPRRDGDERFEIALGNGCLIRVPRSFDDGALRRVLAAVRSEPERC